MKLDIFTVDAFTKHPFSGNPAAVIPTLQVLDENILQQVARELNLSETAYVTPLEGEAWKECQRFFLRWFTPTNEVPLCGHATLATAHVLIHCLGNSNSRLEFETKSGILAARRDGHLITLDFPANPPEPLTHDEEAQLEKLLKVVASHGLSVASVLISRTTKKLLVRLHQSCTRTQLEGLQLDSVELLKEHDGSIVKGVIITMQGGAKADTSTQADDYHCYSRYFAPWNGIPEDPVTGSAHTVLGPYWCEQLGCNVLKCRQVSPRGGDVIVTVRSDGRVDLAGESTTVIEGHMMV